jgi:lysophospholipase L1-like esterase
VEPFTTDLHVLRTGNYADFTELSPRRLRILGEVLALARARGWRVVGFTPPDGSRYVRFFESHPVVGPRWREFGRLMPRLFRRYGFRWLDFRNAAAIPCTDADFVDGGYHTNAACSMRMRARLDAAAGLATGASAQKPLTLVALGDSIPAARPRECEGCTGFVTLYARALARATGRPVHVDNRAVPGATSSDVWEAIVHDPSLRTVLRRADAVIVSAGHNDAPSARVGENVDVLLTEVEVLRGNRPTLIRVTNVYADAANPPVRVRRLNAAICGAARSHYVPCADIRGVSGLLASDHVHPSPRGHRAIARALIRLGFSPLAATGSP